MFFSCARAASDDCCWVLVRDVSSCPDVAGGVLARSAADGYRLAQRHLFRRLAPRVHETLHRMLGSNEGMDDHLQDALVEIFRSLTRNELPVDLDAVDLDAWACAIAARSARRHLEQRVPRLDAALDAGQGGSDG